MVSNNSDRNISFFICTIFNASKSTYLISDSLYCIYIKNRVYTLHNSCNSFKTHTSINVRVVKIRIRTVFFLTELSKYKVPDFHISVTVTTYCTTRLTTTIFFALIIVDFRTWTTWTYTMFPEVIFLTHSENSFWSKTNFFVPNIERFIIILIYRNIKSIFRKFYYLCKEFPCPVNSFSLKIIAKREVTKHFEKCTMACSLTYIFNIACSNTLLASCYSLSWWNLLTCKERL